MLSLNFSAKATFPALGCALVSSESGQSQPYTVHTHKKGSPSGLQKKQETENFSLPRSGACVCRTHARPSNPARRVLRPVELTIRKRNVYLRVSLRTLRGLFSVTATRFIPSTPARRALGVCRESSEPVRAWAAQTVRTGIEQCMMPDVTLRKKKEKKERKKDQNTTTAQKC